MASRSKKKKKNGGFSAEDVTNNLNREVASTSGKKMSLEEATLRKLVVEAVKEKKYSAIKQLLEAFDASGAIDPPAREGGLVIIPKDWDSDHYHASLIWEGSNSWLPKDFKPKLSKIGLRKVEKGKAEHEELRELSEDAHYTAVRALKELAEIPNPLAGLKKPGMSPAELDQAFEKLAPEEQKSRTDTYIKIRALRRMIFEQIEPLQAALDEHNEKWGVECSIPWLEKLPPPFRHPVGYKKPPKHRQFKKGQSGNPAGRPSKKKSRQDLVKAIAFEEISVKEGGKETSKQIIEVVFDTLSLLALTGNPRASSLRTKYLEKYDASRQPKDGYLIVPEQVTVDEYMEDLEVHRQRCNAALEKMMEEDEKLRLPSHSRPRE